MRKQKQAKAAHKPATALVPVSAAPLAVLEETARQAGKYIRQAQAPNTLRAYRLDWEHFEAWCKAHRLAPLPAAPETVALYLSALAETRKVSTIQRRVSAISQAHQAAGHESPTGSVGVRALLCGVRRAKGVAPTTKTALLTPDVRAMLTVLPDGLLGLRDQALLLIGFAGGFRRSELVGLDVADLDFTTDGLVILLRKSKTDPEAAGRKIGIPYGSKRETCPVGALQAWLEASGITEGPVFHPINRHGQLGAGRLTDKAVARVVKRTAEAAGLAPAKYSGHSLRAGLATAAAIGGASERAIMNQTGHRSLGMLRRYIRDGSLFRENAAASLGL